MKKHFPFYAPDNGGIPGNIGNPGLPGEPGEPGYLGAEDNGVPGHIGNPGLLGEPGKPGEPGYAAGTDGIGDTAPTGGNPAKYTEEDMTKIRSDFEAQIKSSTDAAVAAALDRAKLPPGEQAKLAEADRAAALENREKAIAARELRADTAELLTAKQLPVGVIDIVLGADKDATAKNIEAFQKVFDAAVQAQVEKRMAGATPKGGNASTLAVDAFIAGFKSEERMM